MSQQVGPESSAEAGPTCYKHPKRETYLRCSRCDRSICPDCMLEAPVGFHCRDCVQQAQREQPQLRNTLGAKAGTRPILTYALIATMGLLYLASTALVSLQTDWMLNPILVAVFEQYYRLGTATLLHGSLMHLAFNLLALWMFGSNVETMLGHRRFALLYLVSALAGSTASYMFTPLGASSVGASGAIFGLFGAMFVLARKANLESSGLWVVLLLNLGFGFMWPNIDWRAHLGGLLAGVVLAALLTRTGSKHETASPTATSRSQRLLTHHIQWVGVAAVLLVLLAGVWVRTNQIRHQIITEFTDSSTQMICDEPSYPHCGKPMGKTTSV